MQKWNARVRQHAVLRCYLVSIDRPWRDSVLCLTMTLYLLRKPLLARPFVRTRASDSVAVGRSTAGVHVGRVCGRNQRDPAGLAAGQRSS